MEFVNKYGYNITSQNGENGIINECVYRIKPELKAAVEFGAPDIKYCSNIYPLYQQGWQVYYYDINPTDTRVARMRVTPDNVNSLPHCSVLSIDIDGNDYSVWRGYRGKPDIVVIEINSSLDPEIEFFHPDRGASFCTMLRLGEEKGYFLLCHTGNMIFVLNEYKHLFPEIDNAEPIKLFNKKWLQQPA